MSIESDPEEFLRIGDVARLNNVSKSTIHRWVREGVLPRPTRRGAQVAGWTRATLRKHWASRERDIAAS